MKLLTAVLIPLLLLGCSSPAVYEQAQSSSELVSADISDFQRQLVVSQPAAIYVDSPRHQLLPLSIDVHPDWYAYEHQVNSASLPLYFVLEEVANLAGLTMTYTPEVDVNLPVQLQYKGTAKGVLDAVGAVTGLSYSVNDKRVNWSLYQVAQFDLSYVGGNYSYQIGGNAAGDGGGGESGGEGGVNSRSASLLGLNTAQHASVIGASIDVFAEVETALNAILDKDGEVTVLPATGMVMVRTSAGKMPLVKSYMQQLNSTMSQQIMLDVKVLRFTSSQDAAFGVDWQVLRETTGGQLKFIGNYADAFAFETAPSALGVAYKGTEILIKAMEEQGVVSVVTEPKIITQVNRVAKLQEAESHTYLAEMQVETDENGQQKTTATHSQVVEGYSLFVLANVDSKNNIFLHISSQLTDLLGFDRRTTFSGGAIEAPRVQESAFVQTMVLKAGQTMLTSSLKRRGAEASDASPVNVERLPTLKSGSTAVEETIVLLTPTLINL